MYEDLVYLSISHVVMSRFYLMSLEIIYWYGLSAFCPVLRATLWALSVGGNADTQRHEPKTATTKSATEDESYRRKTSLRHLSCFLIGNLTIFANLLNGLPVSLYSLLSEPWPETSTMAIPNTS